MRKSIVAGHWKMHKTPSEAEALIKELIPLVKDAPCEVIVGPTFVCLDRAGVVCGDGPTHHGIFDIALTRPIPGLVVMQPRTCADLARMLRTAFTLDGPAVIRYPRGNCTCAEKDDGSVVAVGRAAVLDPDRIDIGHEDRILAEQRQGVLDAATGFQGLGSLIGDDDARAKTLGLASFQVGFHEVGEIVDIDQEEVKSWNGKLVWEDRA